MITDMSHWLLATFVFTPMQAEIDRHVAAANAAPATVQQVQACMSAAKPALMQRASGDWVWIATTAASLAAGLSEPQQVLKEEVPACREALQGLPAQAQGA
jgi:hypothetical protein